MIIGEFGNSMQRKFRSIDPSFVDDHSEDDHNVMHRVGDAEQNIDLIGNPSDKNYQSH